MPEFDERLAGCGLRTLYVLHSPGNAGLQEGGRFSDRRRASDHRQSGNSHDDPKRTIHVNGPIDFEVECGNEALLTPATGSLPPARILSTGTRREVAGPV